MCHKQRISSTLAAISIAWYGGYGNEKRNGSMGGKKGKKPQKPAPADMLDALRIALSNNDKPSNEFMRVFEGLMRKDDPEDK
jgi:hypothetical protein